MPDPKPPLPPVAESKVVSKRGARPSLVWIVPIVAALAGAWVAVTRIMSEGPKITLVLHSADGIEAGKTKIRYNGVEIGTLTTVRLSDDHKSVLTTAQMEPDAASFLVEDTRFWVVRPRVSGATVSGLGTLVSGAYIGVDIGTSNKRKRAFVALRTPPVVTTDVPGRYFVLKAEDLGSLDNGTPIFFRRLQVGEVTAYQLEEDGKTLSVKVFINAPYDKFVTPNTRFWQASGVDVSLSAAGLTVQTQSVLSILVGGIAFEPPAVDAASGPAEANSEFRLFRDRTEAFKLPSQDPQAYVLLFNHTVRGLEPGAPVEFRGVVVGEVVSVDAKLDIETFDFSVPVTIRMDAQRLGVKVDHTTAASELADVRRRLMDSLVARGTRAQLRSGSLVTGALYVAFDFFPDAPPATIDWAQDPVHLPTIAGEIDAIEASVVNIIKKLDQVPFKEIGDDVRTSIRDLDRTLVSARTTLDDAGKLIAPNSALAVQLDNTLQEMTRAARGLRVLADYLERHPEALLRGKAGEAQ
jgi:paraquat-inducible protein B